MTNQTTIEHYITKLYIYDFLAYDIISIKVTFDIPIILIGDFNSGIATDFEHLYEHECSFLEENQFTSYLKQHNIIKRANRDQYNIFLYTKMKINLLSYVKCLT